VREPEGEEHGVVSSWRLPLEQVGLKELDGGGCGARTGEGQHFGCRVDSRHRLRPRGSLGVHWPVPQANSSWGADRADEAAAGQTAGRRDLQRFDFPTLIAHGDDDQIAPIVAAGEKSSKIVKDNTFKVYPGAPHGLSMVAPFKDVFDADLLAFARG
jgi:pimeloyl-ACP methyl ester carboxylesterase